MTYSHTKELLLGSKFETFEKSKHNPFLKYELLISCLQFQLNDLYCPVFHCLGVVFNLEECEICFNKFSTNFVNIVCKI